MDSPAPQGLPFTLYSEISPNVRKDWLIKGVMAEAETSAWVGAPGAGKSALVTDLSFHASAKHDWRGHKAKAQTLVVYIALERGDLMTRRLAAYKLKYGIAELPFVIVTAAIDLMSPDCVQVLSRTVHDAAGRAYDLGMEVDGVLLVIDTFAKAIAHGGGDENSAKDQNRVLGHLRRFQWQSNAHIALVGHTGKDETRGARGSNAHVGDVDLMVQIGGDRVKEAKVIKANDQPEGRLTTFTLETYTFGQDEDGDPITTSIVTQDAPTEAPVAGRKTLSPNQIVALEALDEAVGNHGVDVSALYQLPKGIKGASFEQWRTELIGRGVLRADDKHVHQSFRKLRLAMDAKKLIGVRDQLVWRATSL